MTPRFSRRMSRPRSTATDVAKAYASVLALPVHISFNHPLDTVRVLRSSKHTASVHVQADSVNKAVWATNELVAHIEKDPLDDKNCVHAALEEAVQAGYRNISLDLRRSAVVMHRKSAEKTATTAALSLKSVTFRDLNSDLRATKNGHNVIYGLITMLLADEKYLVITLSDLTSMSSPEADSDEE